MKSLQLACTLLIVACCASRAMAQAAAKVVVVQPERKAIRQLVEQPASLEALETTPIFARVPGYIERIAVDMGDKVTGPELDKDGKQIKPGQTLAVLSLPELERDVQQRQAAISEAKSQVDQAYAEVRVSESKIVSARTQVAASEAAIRRCEALVAQQRAELDRVTKLAERQALSQKVVDEARAAYQAAEADRDAATAKLEAAAAGIKEAEALLGKSQADRAAADARVKVTEAALAQSQTMLDYGTVRAPFAGVVSRRGVHTGHFVQPAGQGQPLFEVTRIDTIRVYIDVPESVAALIDNGDPVTVRFPSAAIPPLEGQITRMSWTLDKATRTLKAEVEVPNPSGKLRPGMYAYTSIVAAEKKDALVLPVQTLIADKQQTFCACVEDGKVVRKEVKLGLRTPTEVEIVEGLQGNEQVIRANAAGFAVGQAVEVSTPAPAAGS